MNCLESTLDDSGQYTRLVIDCPVKLDDIGDWVGGIDVTQKNYRLYLLVTEVSDNYTL